MLKHFVLNLNPHAQFEWERCALIHPITAEQPDLAQLLAADLTHQIAGTPKSGSYLIAVNIEVTVLEATAAEPVASPVVVPTVAEASALAEASQNGNRPIVNSVAPRLTRSIDRTPAFAEVA